MGQHALRQPSIYSIELNSTDHLKHSMHLGYTIQRIQFIYPAIGSLHTMNVHSNAARRCDINNSTAFGNDFYVTIQMRGPANN